MYIKRYYTEMSEIFIRTQQRKYDFLGFAHSYNTAIVSQKYSV